MSHRRTSHHPRLRANEPTKLEKLTRLKNYGTRYEVSVTFPDGHEMLIGYTMQRSKFGLLAAMRKQGPAILARIPGNLEDDNSLNYSKTAGFTLGHGTRINFTGHTQRDAIIRGELPFVGVDRHVARR